MSDSQNTTKDPKVKSVIMYPIFVGAFVSEFFLFTSELSPFSKFFFHIFIVNICLITTFAFYYKQWDLRFPIYFIILLAAIGPFGPLVCLLTLALYQIHTLTSHTLDELLASLFPEPQHNPTELLYERIVHGLDEYDPDYNPLPFMDVISFGTEKQKRMAIEKILRYFRPEFAPALLRALQDPSNGIRVLAATAITTLDQLFFDRYLALEKEFQDSPDDPKAVLVFAEHCDQYASSQILDEERSKKMNSQAIEGYEKFLKLNPTAGSVFCSLGRNYIKNNQPEKAKVLLENVINNFSVLPPDTYKWYMTALYSLKDYTTLRAFASRIAENDSFKGTQEMQELVLAWRVQES